MSIFSKKRNRHNAYCAFCRTPRRLTRKKNISFGNFLSAALVSPIVMWLMWGAPDARVFVIFVCFLAISEYFVQIRWRLSVVCRACGFDPVLYVKDPQRAAQLVKQQLDKRKESATAALARPLHLPTVTTERALAIAKAEEMRSAKPGRLVSRDV